MDEAAYELDRDLGTVREDFGYILVKLARHWRRWLDQRLGPKGMTQATWTTLVHLARGGNGMVQKDLARFIGVEGPSLVRLLDRLEEQGLVERVETEEDRRVRRTRLTERAQPKVSQIGDIAAELRQDLLDGISDEELAFCIRVFRRIASNAARTGLRAPAFGEW